MNDLIDSYKRLPYNSNPDYKSQRIVISHDRKKGICQRLTKLYGNENVGLIYSEIERLISVHSAHKTDCLIKEELDNRSSYRFSEKDVILITYGDLVVSENRGALNTLADFTNVFFEGLISTLHILPFFPYSSDRGFSVISYFDVNPEIGSWKEIDEIGSSFKLMFDCVFNHCSAQNDWFRRFLNGDPDYKDFFISFDSLDFIDEDLKKIIFRPRASELFTKFNTINGSKYVWTTFSPDQVDLNFKNYKVLLKIVEIMLFYVRKGADILRFDAVTYLWYEIGTTCANHNLTHEIIKLFREILDIAAPGTAIITETNIPHKENISYFGDNSDEANMVYNFALPPLILHTFISENSDILSNWADSLKPPSDENYFLNFLDSHDGIGLMGAYGVLSQSQISEMVKWVTQRNGFVTEKLNENGDKCPYELNITWFSALNDDSINDPQELQINRFIASRSIPLVLQGVPAIYLPGIFGSKNDVEAVCRENSKRSINRQIIQEEQLFNVFSNRDSISWHIAKRYIDLLEKRVVEPAFHPNASQEIFNLSSGAFAVLRCSLDNNTSVFCVINITQTILKVNVPVDKMQINENKLIDLITNEYFFTDIGTLEINMYPYQIVWLKGS